MVCFLVITYKRDVAPIADQIPHPFYLSQFHLSIFTGSIHPVSICSSYMLNLNVALRLLSRIMSNHRLLLLHFSRFYVIFIPVESSHPLKTKLRIVNLMTS